MENKSLTKYCYPSSTTKEWLEHIAKSHFSAEELQVKRVENAILMPDMAKVGAGFAGGVFLENGEIVESSFQRFGLDTAQKLFELYDPKTAKKESKETVYLGQYRNQWGSFLVDSVSRLWFALQEPEKYNYAFAATQASLGGIHKNAYNFFSRLGIKKEQITLITEPTVFDSLIIPEMSLTPYGTRGNEPSWHKEYLETVHRVTDSVMAENAGKEYPEKVYFSRGRFAKEQKSDFGEELIAEMMKKNGYYIVYPEEHTLEEQIMFVNNCKEFASVGGSCAHNVIFSKTAPKMMLFNRMNGYQWHQWMLDEMAGVEPITYVDSYSEPYKFIFKTKIGGPYLFWINKQVKSFAKDNAFKLPERGVCAAKIFIRYSLRVAYTLASRIKKRLLK